MLVLLLRLVFVILSVLIGIGSGQYFYRDVGLDPWFGGAMGFGIAVTLIAAEQGFRRHFTRSLVAFILGLAAGLCLSFLLLAVMEQVIQSEDLRHNLDVPLVLIVTYLVMITVIRSADRFRVIIPFVEFRAERGDEGSVVLSPDAIGDPRLKGLLASGVLTQRLLIHRRVLAAIEADAQGDDPASAARGKRALEALTELRARERPAVVIDETELPNTPSLADALIRLSRLENARLVCADQELVRLARAEALTVIDLQGLAQAFSHQIRPGEVIDVTIVKPGDGSDQGVGYLDDGSMVIVSKAGGMVGQSIHATVLRLHPTANGRMVFAERT
jgi:uncharacterized protein YacL